MYTRQAMVMAIIIFILFYFILSGQGKIRPRLVTENPQHQGV